jgi:hypothetical protein
MLAGNDAYSPTGYYSIATATATSGTTSLTFSSIPSNYKSLVIRGMCADDGGATNQRNQRIRFNADSGTNYSYHITGGGTPGTYVNGVASASFIEFGYYGGSDNSLAFRNFIIDIEDYALVNKFKTLRALDGWSPTGGPGNAGVDLVSGLWRSTSAITSLTITIDTGQAFQTGSTFALYGVS